MKEGVHVSVGACEFIDDNGLSLGVHYNQGLWGEVIEKGTLGQYFLENGDVGIVGAATLWRTGSLIPCFGGVRLAYVYSG